jgi:hypothetical protein
MPASSQQYRDLLWDFACSSQCFGQEGPRESSLVNLQVFAGEEEMFESSRSAEGIPISLPLDWLNEMKVSRADVTRALTPSPVLLDLGRRLLAAIPDSAKQPLFEASIYQPCRLKISGNSPLIGDLPWEWLSDEKGPLALRPEVRLVRSVPLRLQTPPLTVEPPVRVLLVITNPKDERLLNPFQEIEAVIQRLQAPPYTVRVLEEPTWEALEMALKDEPHILHYIGHAGIDRGEGNIILHDSRNISHWISGPDLSQALPLTVRLLCLSTCFTAPNYQILGLPRLAHTAASYRLPTTVTNCSPVDQMSVRTFWGEFYAALEMENGNVNEAFHRAQGAVATSTADNATWGSFSLVIRDRSGEVFRLEAAGASSKERQADEIQAQLASRLANDLAVQMAVLGAEASDSLRETVAKEILMASDLTKKVL